MARPGWFAVPRRVPFALALVTPLLAGALMLGDTRAAGAEPYSAQASATSPGLTVTGESTVMVAPDVAYLTVGVQVSARTAREASASNATQVAALIEAVTRAGIPPSAIRTIGLSLRPTYSQRNPADGRPPVISGYEATNQVEVTIATVSQAGEILDAAVGAGANLAGNLRFAIKDDDAVVAQALREAAADARARADAIATGLGTRVTGILAASDDAGGVVRPMYADAVAPRAMTAQAMAPETPVSPGELTYRARVRVTFAIGG